MGEAIKALVNILELTGAGYASVKVGKYTIILTDEDEGSERMKQAWDKYMDEEREEEENE